MVTQLALVPAAPSAWPASLDNGSEMGVRIRDFDWSATPLGPIEQWPQSLRSYVSMLVANTIGNYIFWGPDHVAIYNDAFLPIPGNKHPGILGTSSAEGWPEIREQLDRLLIDVLTTNRAVTLIDEHYPIARFGHLEGFYCTISYSPLGDESGAVAGVFSTLTETTQNVLGQRRIETLRSLAARSAETLTELETYAKIGSTLAQSADLPFALLYLRDGSSSVARLATSAGFVAGDLAAPREIRFGDADAAWPVWDVLASGRQATIDDLADRFERLPSGWPEAPHKALLMPITPSNQSEAVGVLIAGTSPRLRLDDPYREFLSLTTSAFGRQRRLPRCADAHVLMATASNNGA